jgi:4-hydroxy-3-methylbut-2-en-1-yl diphosphate synthase IspG/GcpE
MATLIRKRVLPVEEVKVGVQILQSLSLRPRKLEIEAYSGPGETT